MRASAFVGGRDGDSPVTRKQTSLFWAAYRMEDERFSRLHELFKWDAWLYEAAVKVLRLIYPDVVAQEEYAKMLTENLQQEFRSNGWKLSGESSKGVRFQQIKQSVIRTAIGMALEPIWRARRGLSLKPDGGDSTQVHVVRALVELLEGNVQEQRVVVVQCFPAIRDMRSKAAIKPLRRYIRDKVWLDVLHRVCRSGVMTCLGSTEPYLNCDRELAWLLCDIALAPLDDLMTQGWTGFGDNEFVPEPIIRTSECHYFRRGSEIVCLVNGSLAEAQAVQRTILMYLREELGLCDVESSISDASGVVELNDVVLLRDDNSSHGKRRVRLREEQIALYRSAVRALTSASNIGRYGVDVIVLSLNRIIREWSRSLESCRCRGLLETLDVWTERKVLRFLVRLYSKSSHKSVIKRFFGCMGESIVSDQRDNNCSGLKVEFDEDTTVFFLDKLRRFESFVIQGSFAQQGDIRDYRPKCAVCFGAKGLRVCLSDRCRTEVLLEDFIILCDDCLRDIESRSKL